MQKSEASPLEVPFALKRVEKGRLDSSLRELKGEGVNGEVPSPQVLQNWHARRHDGESPRVGIAFFPGCREVDATSVRRPHPRRSEAFVADFNAPSCLGGEGLDDGAYRSNRAFYGHVDVDGFPSQQEVAHGSTHEVPVASGPPGDPSELGKEGLVGVKLARVHEWAYT